MARAVAKYSWGPPSGLAGERVFRSNQQGELVIEGVDPYADLIVEAPGYRTYDLSRTQLGDEPMLVELLPSTADAGADLLYGGVGIGWGKDSEIASVTPGGPAQRAGVVPGDVFWKVNDQEVPASEAIPLIRGPVGTPVRLAFHRADGGVLDETMIRETIDPNALK